MPQKITLLELNKNIQEKINTNFPDTIWVIAEISELKINRNGHCYLELIEKDAITDNIIARSRATIWAFTFRMLRPYFENTTGRELSPGIKILIQVKVEYHELYGLSLNITDIDPNYTLGDLAQKKAEILKKLESDGVINMNKELPFPTVPQKIAIVSSATAAGYQDFIGQLENNSFGYKFYTKLFQSTMQGLQAEESIIGSLEKIYSYEDFFDLVVIIRGGGSQSDLSCFDNYLLSANIAQFTLPVLTGIGHDKDESIVDIVAHKKLKTPTAVAEYIIEKVSDFEDNLFLLKDNITNLASDYIFNQQNKINHYGDLLVPTVKNKIDKYNFFLYSVSEKIKNNTIHYNQKKETYLLKLYNSIEKKSTKLIFNQSEKIAFIKNKLKLTESLYLQKQNLILNNLESRNILLDPNNVLKRGYSITYVNGNILKDIKKIKENDSIITKLSLGYIRSTVNEKSKNKSK